jgi:hypothetical protein
LLLTFSFVLWLKGHNHHHSGGLSWWVISYGSWIYNYLSMQLMPITTNVMSSNPAYGEVYSIHYYLIKFVTDLLLLTYVDPVFVLSMFCYDIMQSSWVEENLYRFFFIVCYYINCAGDLIIRSGMVMIPLTILTLVLFCACPKPQDQSHMLWFFLCSTIWGEEW